MRCINYLLIGCFLLFCLTSCGGEDTVTKSFYRYLKPAYGEMQIVSTTDTLHFPLSDSSYNDIESLNVFEDNDTEFISFFDRRSAALLIYRSAGGNVVKRIPLKKFLKKGSLKKNSIYVRNYDSILITNKNNLYLFDSSGHLKNSAAFIETPANAYALLDNTSPPVIVGTKLYTGVRQSVFNEQLKVYRKWKVIYEFQLEDDSAELKYNLPEMYHTHLYGFQYLSNSFCYNHHNRFVLSFGADTNIYETDLNDYNITYYGKTLQQHMPAKWKSNKEGKDEEYKNYLTGEAYGAIYFDPFMRRYLRVAKKSINEEEYVSKNWSREQSLIIFDENFRIIGESAIEKSISLSTLLFTKDKKMYARINRKDEYGIHFIRLEYKDGNSKVELTRK